MEEEDRKIRTGEEEGSNNNKRNITATIERPYLDIAAAAAAAAAS